MKDRSVLSCDKRSHVQHNCFLQETATGGYPHNANKITPPVDEALANRQPAHAWARACQVACVLAGWCYEPDGVNIRSVEAGIAVRLHNMTVSVLMVAEKPSLAASIAQHLSGGNVSRFYAKAPSPSAHEMLRALSCMHGPADVLPKVIFGSS